MINTGKSKANYLTFLVGIACLVGLASCSKKVIYTAPSSLSQEYVSSLSDEKTIR
jgi:hypothetical protein